MAKQFKINRLKILFVASGNNGKISPFIHEQAESLKKEGVDIEYFLIKGKGILGYISNIFRLFKQIRRSNYNIIHAHYGLSGLFANIQRRKPVVLTIHGSDINEKKIYPFTKLAIWLSAHSIFVSNELKNKSGVNKDFSIIPCGINLEDTNPIKQFEAKKILGWNQNKKYILFSSSFDNKVKNPELAIKAVSKLEHDVELIELKGYDRSEVVLLQSACDMALMTSFSEGSPQFIKESMACNLPIVSTDVGDVKDVISQTEGCYICSFEPNDVLEKIAKALNYVKRTNGRSMISNFDNHLIARSIINDCYLKILRKEGIK